MNLSDTVKQRYRYNTTDKTISQIERELRSKGVQCFVVGVSKQRVTAIVSKAHVKRNRECLK